MFTLPKLEPHEKYVIYGVRLTHDFTYEYRYVGFTSRPRTRFFEHIRYARTEGHRYYLSHRSNWIRKHNFNVTFDILEVVEEKELLSVYEIKWTHILKEKGHRLTNKTEGGEGNIGWVPSEETRSKMVNNNWSKRGLPHPRLGKTVSEETKQRISRSLLKGREPKPKYVPKNEPKKIQPPKMSKEEFKQLMSEKYKGEGNPFYGKKHTVESRNKQILAQTGKKRNVSKSTCPHCNLTGGSANMKRHHFDNCKSISTIPDSIRNSSLTIT